ncbi:MAG: transmembrane(s)protein [candidate division WS6 bacterium 34_10]|uniref:Transmembrane(S)protein n=1 Tax=candidate division WS6 bacterium 34_10 TaxID=1641389 RepID=A0A101HIS4_9BACT|nr:MAG: transmembrane(s)protein [candidate division WS6 bacterium 34_10]
MANTQERRQFKYMEVLRNPPSKQVMYYLALFTFLAAILLIVFAVRPTILTITGIRKEIKEKESINNALEKKIEALANLDSQYSENKETLDSLQLLFPTSGNFSLFLSNIDAVISRNGFVLKNVGFSEYKEDISISTTVVSPWGVSLSVIGPENNLDNLFNDLEAMPMYPVIESFSYGENEEETMNSYNLSIRIYHIENNKFYGAINELD